MKEMIKNKEKGFTLIELLAVIVVLAILALIAVPIVLNIINKANKQAEERSIESYVRALDYAISECMMENPKLKKSEIIIDNYEVKNSSTNEVCAKIDVSKGTEMTGCTYVVSDNEKGYNLVNCKIKDNYYNYIDGKVVEEKEMTYRAYNVGDKITYNGMKFYVIAPSDTKQDYVTLLKDEPLTSSETTTYGSTSTYVTSNGYGGAYYDNTDPQSSDYDESEIKKVVEAWSKAKLTQYDLKIDSLGYKARLLTHDELTTNLGYEKRTTGTVPASSNGETPSWVYNSDYIYWTMSPFNDSDSIVWLVDDSGCLYDHDVGGSSSGLYNRDGVVRPVINLLKSAI